jgi:hypothetical protein
LLLPQASNARLHVVPDVQTTCPFGDDLSSTPSTDSALVPSFLAFCSEIESLSSLSDASYKINHLSFAGDCVVTAHALTFHEALLKASAQRFLLSDRRTQTLIERWWTELAQSIVLLCLLRFPLTFEGSQG